MDDYSLKALLDQALPRKNIPLTRALVEKATASQVVTRMLNNLKGSYYESQDMQKYSIANEMVLAIDQYNPDAIRDKGVLLMNQGQPDQALMTFKMYLELNPEAEDAERSDEPRRVLKVCRRHESRVERRDNDAQHNEQQEGCEFFSHTHCDSICANGSRRYGRSTYSNQSKSAVQRAPDMSWQAMPIKAPVKWAWQGRCTRRKEYWRRIVAGASASRGLRLRRGRRSAFVRNQLRRASERVCPQGLQ